MSWSSTQYVKFEAARNRPIHDLLARLPAGQINRTADLGCGPGNSTERLQARYPDAQILGIDSSRNMLAAARRRLPEIEFHQTDIASWHDDGPFDVILANASLHWIPDHDTLFPALVDKLAPGGRLAAQMPDNFDEPAHRLMRQVAAAPRWADKLAGATASRAPRHDAAWYFGLLDAMTTDIDIWRTTYHHRLAEGADDVVEWFKGSALRPYLDRLEAGEQADFLAEYRAAIETAYPMLADGTLILPFPRLFIVAER